MPVVGWHTPDTRLSDALMSRSPLPPCSIVLRLVEPILPGLSVAASDDLKARLKAKKTEAATSVVGTPVTSTGDEVQEVTGANGSTPSAKNKKKKSKRSKKNSKATGGADDADGQPGTKAPKVL